MISSASSLRAEKRLAVILAAICFLLHLAVNLTGGYGLFRDELYYLACSDNLAWGYVDQPPFSLFVLRLIRLVAGDSLVAVRMIPALAHAGTVALVGLIVCELGGRRFAVFVACLATTVSIIHLAFGGFYSMNSLDILLWSATVYVLLILYRTGNHYYWLLLGVLLGVGLLNKISVLFFGAGIFVSLVIAQRRWLATPWPYIAGALALLLFLPYIVWNLQHDLAHLEFIQRANAGKYSTRTRWDFIQEQLILLNPFNIPLWAVGLVALFAYKPLRPYRWLGWMFMTVFIILLINGTSKGEYMAAAYGCLFAAGAVWCEQRLVGRGLYWIRYAYTGVLIAGTLVVLPSVLPMLPAPDYVAYAEAVGLKPTSNENKELSELPQFYADMFGWKEKADAIGRAYRSLSPEDQARCAIISDNYGRCGAIDYYGRAYGLPKAIGTHNNYWIWGPRDHTGEVMIILGGRLKEHAEYFESCEKVGVVTCQYCMPYENNVGVYVGRKLKKPLAEIWDSLKHYD
ncbi:ArnT family glycosyltransferase [Dawidia soli]|uniref:Glycosyltransferase family 39 protein n=1 Tax=Dawidia soli TaxID=2782352 RepID=A0AAP2DJ19_9BACT|nr:glycosyltransferase family 39 protein [Dawidia soli]MBT1690327.1 glycosyltransferase family 39 protein [Dawidia soli]